ncbi:hypothetical protein PDL71_15530 [Lacibacter sp. MH-610]|uniref:hypothetical protein n=1 Tax=Lacibacter sp. MH-610 TaxID=3020883 RepID=UPI0038913D55
MSYEAPAKESVVFWQTNEENGVGEPALLIEFYNDVMQISQDGERININYESIKDLVKILRTANERKPS